jgi:MFS family permease
MVIVNTVVYVRGYLGGSETDTAIALAGFGFGSMVAALALPGLLKKYPDRRFMLAGGGLLVIGLLLGGLGPSLPGLIVIWALLGVGGSLVQTPAGRLIVRSSRAGDRPAFYAAQFALSHACWLIAYPLAGWVGAGASLMVAFAIMAGTAALSVLAAVACWRRESDAALLHRHEAITHEHLHVHDEHHQHDHQGHEGDEPHSHPHQHDAIEHSHEFMIDLHHPFWPTGQSTQTGSR